MKLPASAVVNVQNHNILPSNSGQVNQLNFQDLIDLHCMNYESRKNYDSISGNDDNSSSTDLPVVFYFPNGTYNFALSNIDPVGFGLRWTADVKIIGESRDGVILKLLDGQQPSVNNPTYNNPKFFIGMGEAQVDNFGRCFNSHLEDLTIDSGSNNAGIVALHFYGSNKTSVRNVRIRSGDGQGVCGIFHRSGSGPGILENVLIEGFDYSVRPGGGCVYTDSEFKNPNIRCIHYDRNQGDNRGGGAGDHTLTLVNCKYTGDKQFFYQNGSDACVTFISCSVTGTGSANTKIAIDQNCSFFVRDCTITGYQTALRDRTYSRTFTTVPQEYASDVYTLHSVSNPKSLKLTIPAKPKIIYPTDVNQWVSVASFGADQDNGNLDAVAIQNCIDSGAEYIYFPKSSKTTGGGVNYIVDRTIVIRGNVKMIFMFDNRLKAESPNIGINNPIWKFESTTADYLVMKMVNSPDFYHSALCAFQHVSSKPVVLQDWTAGTPFNGSNNSYMYISEPGCGNVWFDCALGEGVLLNNATQTAIGEYINLEAAKFAYPNPTTEREIPHYLNVKAGKIVCYFTKLEGFGTNRTIANVSGNDSYAEIMGVWNSITTAEDRPNRTLSAFNISNNGKLSIQGGNLTAFGTNSENNNDGGYYNFAAAVRENKNGTTQEIVTSTLRGSAPNRQIALFSNTNTYTGNGLQTSTTVTPTVDTPTSFVLSPTDTSCVANWSQTGTTTSWIFEYKQQSTGTWTVVPAITTKPYTLTGLTQQTVYDVRVKAVNATVESAYLTGSFTTLATGLATFPLLNPLPSSPSVVASRVFNMFNRILTLATGEIKNITSTALRFSEDIGYDVILVAGQSNALGYGFGVDSNYDFYDAKILQFPSSGSYIDQMIVAYDPLFHHTQQSNRIGFAVPFSKQYSMLLPANRKILLLPCAAAGTGFSNNRWNPNNDLYNFALNQVSKVLNLNKANRIVAVLWHQGEADTSLSKTAYATALDTMIAGMRSNLSSPNLPFILGELNRAWVSNVSARLAIQEAIQETPLRVANTSLVLSDSLALETSANDPDQVHFSAASQRTLGERYFRSFLVPYKSDAPIAAQNVTFTGITQNSTTVNWEQAGLFTTWNVEHKLSSGTTWTVSNNLTVRTFNITGLASNTNYDVRIRTNHTNGSTYSTVYNVTTNGGSPVAPTKPTFTNNTTGTSVTVNWTNSGPVTTYTLEWKPASSSTWTVVTGITSTSYNLTGLSAAVEYDVRVKTVFNAQETSYSPIGKFVSFLTVATPQFQFKLDGNLTDASGNNVVATIGQNVTFVNDSERGQVAFLNGGSNGLAYITVPVSTNTTFTKSAWIKLNQTNNAHILSTNGSAGSTSDDNVFWISNSNTNGVPNTYTLKAGHTTAINMAAATTVFTTGVWYHVLVSYNNSPKRYQVYINGVKQADVSGVADFPGTPSPIYIGAYDLTITTQSPNAYISDVRMWNVAFGDGGAKYQYDSTRPL